MCLIHGWAANRHVFDPLRPLLPPVWRNHWFAPDLPGHGEASFGGVFDIAACADTLAAQLPGPSQILGWSLGGLVALHLAARHPHQVKSLCLTASFAKFLAADDYPEGLQRPALAKMVALFNQDYHKYLRQFIELQLLHTPEKRALLPQWMPALTQYGPPPALAAALEALAADDARPLLANIHCPVLLVYGGRDSITPPRMGEYLQRQLKHSQLHILPQAAHMPFLSHDTEFADLLGDFWSCHA